MNVAGGGVLPEGNTRLLGAVPDREKGGTNFAFYAGKDASAVELCLFDKAQGVAHETRYTLTAKEEVKDNSGNTVGYIWNGFAAGVKPGALYGFRVSGNYKPEEGKYFNHEKLLIDPAAKAVTGEIHEWNARHYANNFGDNADIMPKARVVDCEVLYAAAAKKLPAYPDVAPLGSLYTHADSHVLEMHVKGGTWDHPGIPEAERAKFSGLANKSFIKFIKRSGYNGLELMPPASFGTDPITAEREKVVYSGYQPMAPTAPHTDYAATGRPEEEFAHTIRKLKENGIEVVMDVVPNHTLEGGHGGPALHLRGMDDTLYHYPSDGNDWTGSGNTRDFGHPINIRLFTEELKHWRKMGVSAFRIDLAGIIGRVHGSDFNRDSPMMKIIHEDPELRDVRISVEPYDLGPNGYQVSNLASVAPETEGKVNVPEEWDPRYRDTMRTVAFNTKVEVPREQIIVQLVGGKELYQDPQRRVAKLGSHDGATRADSISAQYGKNNWWHREGNKDGNDINPDHYWGSMSDRQRVQRFADGLLAITQGPILSVLGDDRNHSMGYDSNFWCMDADPHSPENGRAHMPWGKAVSPEGHELMRFKSAANKFRNRHTALRRGTLFTGDPDIESHLTYRGATMKDVTWLEPDGSEMTGHAMKSTNGFGILLSGDPGNTPPSETNPTRRVNHKRDQPLLLLLNTTMHDIEFTVPDVPGVKWDRALNTLTPSGVGGRTLETGHKIMVGYKSMIALEGQRELARDAYSKPSHCDLVTRQENLAIPGGPHNRG